MADFQIAVALTLKHEGGYTSGLANDPGGETNFGISKAAYPYLDIANLTRDQAIDIYQKDYWHSLYASLSDQSLCNALFDFGVNAGDKTAVLVLQRCLGVTEDGVFGAETLGVANSDPGAAAKFFLERMRHYATRGNWKSFARAWTERALDFASTSAREPNPQNIGGG